VLFTYDGKDAKATSFICAILTVQLGDPPHHYSMDIVFMTVARFEDSSQ